MHPDTERRLVRALQTSTPWPYLAKEWGISQRQLQRIAAKHGIKKPQAGWDRDLVRGKRKQESA